MSIKAINYKTYQQVLDLASDNKCTTKAAKTASPPKRRTKSGCLTCRRRKKKCDEEKVGGKCQACIRNFLDCCWPGEVSHQHPETESVAQESTSTKSTTTLIIKEEKPTKGTGASAYPSPLMSPRAETADDFKDIKPLELPKSSIKTKVTKPAKKKSTRKAPAQFIVTSFDQDRALCQVKV